jgi:lipoprotein-releasing system permease protein
MSFERFIAWRFMLKGTERGSLSPMTFFVWLAIGIGIGAMCSLLSVMYGFESSLKERVLKAYPHVMIKSRSGTEMIGGYESWTERLKKIPGATRVEPYLESEMIIQSDRRALGGVIWGLRFEDLEKLKSGITEGDLPPPNTKFAPAIIGTELAHRLGVNPGDNIRILSPIGKAGAFGLVPQSDDFHVSGLYASGHYEFDQQYLYLVLEDMQDLLKASKRITGWHVWGESVDSADELQRQIEKVIPASWKAESWTTFNSALFQSLKLEQYAMFIILSFAVAIAALNIVITLIMHVAHKKKNIGILRALGASKKQIARIFQWNGVFLGAVGLIIGTLLAVVIIVYIRYFSHYLLPDIYYDRTLPTEIRPWSMAMVYLVACLMIAVSTIYPSRRAAMLDPIDAIRE